MTASQPGGLEAIVRSCIKLAATEKGIPDDVTVRLLKLADDVASGDLDPSSGTETQRRIELLIKGYGASS
ncbi:MAG: hypothetical protein JO345_29165 [Streptosporangiaceae bacterium]|nr:hypothetical protein [Streptosporangiaceae bacterium]